MWRDFRVLALVGVALLAAGCPKGPKTLTGVPVIKTFSGRLVHNGQPVQFTPAQHAKVELTHTGPPSSKGSFGFEIGENGELLGHDKNTGGSTTTIGSMPIGNYYGVLERAAPMSGRPTRFEFFFEIKEGTTDYNIELGPNFSSGPAKTQ